MAKILTGPLAAGLSGKLGPVVFHQTKFGQVVQSKAKPRIYDTPAAQATKRAFRAAASAYAMQGAGHLWNLKRAFDTVGKSGQGQWISQVSAAVRGETTSARVAADCDYYLLRDLAETAPGVWTYYADAYQGAPGQVAAQHSFYQLDDDLHCVRRIIGQRNGLTGQVSPLAILPTPPFFVLTVVVSLVPVGDYSGINRAGISNCLAVIP